jgi:hypothetical protein
MGFLVATREAEVKPSLKVYLQEFEVFQIEISKTYGKVEWHDDIKKVLKLAGEANKKVGAFSVRFRGVGAAGCVVVVMVVVKRSQTYDGKPVNEAGRSLTNLEGKDQSSLLRQSLHLGACQSH